MEPDIPAMFGDEKTTKLIGHCESRAQEPKHGCSLATASVPTEAFMVSYMSMKP